MNRKPRPYNPPIVTPEDEREWLETLAARDESNATALDNYYAQDEWWFYSEEARQARERLDALYETLPEGTLANRTGEDLETGNFDDAQFVLPDGSTIDVTYTGE